MTVSSDAVADALTIWAARHGGPRPAGSGDCATGEMRFAFYARTSTTRFQNSDSLIGWQRQAAHDLIGSAGRITSEFVDLGCSRSVAWSRRPQASALLATLGSPDHGFDAVVIGEYERAFTGRQLSDLLPWLDAIGVRLWLPEFDGPIHRGDPTHEAMLLLLGSQSRRELARARYRTLAAMRTQTTEQGRYLGGRPPYGYQLVDAGPHPNQAHAQWGRRLHRLDPDPVAAVNVTWIFAQRRSGRSIAGIARNLNDAAIPCPSSYDPSRNRHRSGHRWTVRTVAAILANPRYTGRQVWNRQARTRSDSPGPEDRRWTDGAEWVISRRVTNPGLVSEDDFLAAQAIKALPIPADGSVRRYALTGLAHCGLCKRRMDAQWSHGRPGYRCRHGRTSADTVEPDRPRNLYLSEARILALVAPELAARHLLDDDAPATAITAVLRATQLTIVCGFGAATVQEP